jgi:hypothetical protein
MPSTVNVSVRDSSGPARAVQLRFKNKVVLGSAVFASLRKHGIDNANASHITFAKSGRPLTEAESVSPNAKLVVRAPANPRLSPTAVLHRTLTASAAGAAVSPDVEQTIPVLAPLHVHVAVVDASTGEHAAFLIHKKRSPEIEQELANVFGRRSGGAPRDGLLNCSECERFSEHLLCVDGVTGLTPLETADIGPAFETLRDLIRGSGVDWQSTTFLRDPAAEFLLGTADTTAFDGTVRKHMCMALALPKGADRVDAWVSGERLAAVERYFRDTATVERFWATMNGLRTLPWVDLAAENRVRQFGKYFEWQVACAEACVTMQDTNRARAAEGLPKRSGAFAAVACLLDGLCIALDATVPFTAAHPHLATLTHTVLPAIQAARAEAPAARGLVLACAVTKILFARTTTLGFQQRHPVHTGAHVVSKHVGRAVGAASRALNLMRFRAELLTLGEAAEATPTVTFGTGGVTVGAFEDDREQAGNLLLLLTTRECPSGSGALDVDDLVDAPVHSYAGAPAAATSERAAKDQTLANIWIGRRTAAAPPILDTTPEGAASGGVTASEAFPKLVSSPLSYLVNNDWEDDLMRAADADVGSSAYASLGIGALRHFAKNHPDVAVDVRFNPQIMDAALAAKVTSGQLHERLFKSPVLYRAFHEDKPMEHFNFKSRRAHGWTNLSGMVLDGLDNVLLAVRDCTPLVHERVAMPVDGRNVVPEASLLMHHSGAAAVMAASGALNPVCMSDSGEQLACGVGLSVACVGHWKSHRKAVIRVRKGRVGHTLLLVPDRCVELFKYA